MPSSNGSASHGINLLVQLTVKVTAFQTGWEMTSPPAASLRHKAAWLKLKVKGLLFMPSI